MGHKVEPDAKAPKISITLRSKLKSEYCDIFLILLFLNFRFNQNKYLCNDLYDIDTPLGYQYFLR